jgi:anti-sigma regulatory factor (Ser/Thr protein kinase)
MSAITAPFETGPQLDMTLPADARAPAVARAAVRTLAGRLPPTLLEDLVLVASELATNALRHAPLTEPPTVSVWLSADRAVLTVSSAVGPHFDRDSLQRAPGPEGGFGLRVVETLADRWWVERDGTTRVVCEFALFRM